MASEWMLQPGDTIVRSDLHATYGGRAQGGIGPSAKTPNVFLFTDPAVGQQHGYFDGWASDGTFHYTGEGQRGDQEFVQGNRAVLEHREQGRALQLFHGSGGSVTYLGQFETDPDEPYRLADAPETGDGPIREVIVFRLRPLNEVVRDESDALPEISGPTVAEVPVEALNAEKFFVQPNRAPVEAERREQGLVHEYRDHLKANGHHVARHRYTPPGETKPLFCDLFDETARVLVEAKGSNSRNDVRMALGQLADYGRFEHATVTKAILLPRRPRPDLEQLIRSQDVQVIWRTGPSQFQSGPGMDA